MVTFEQFRSTFPEDNNEKGEAFEVFLAEWMFKNQPVLSSQFKKVWKFSDWPKAWSGREIGTDLIAEDYNGKICAIQAKFYDEDSTVSKSDIDSFLSDTSRKIVDYRYLIATTDRLSDNAKSAIKGQEKPVYRFSLSDFLDPFNWPRSLASLNKKYKPHKPHKPRPHQRKAINDVTKKLEGRGQLIMACGTGKTLTGQRIAEKLECKTTLVLLPSLLLLSKTAKDWVSEREQDFILLPVCSDKSVTKGTDEIALSDSELPFRSTTDPAEIAKFLRRKGNKVVFSTYQSSPQIAEAFKLSKLKPFDLILADEAHRCAGKISAEYSTVLDSEKIPAKRRLFMTATPRMYSSNLRKKAKEADIQIASMDDEAVFGPVLHRLTFGQAIANTPKPLLTDYRVLVVGVKEASYREMVKERTLLETESGVVDDARSLATQLGLSKAVKDYDLKRVISFHSRVNLARDFAGSFLDFQSDLKAKAKPKGKLTYSHVSGKMPTSERSKRVRALGALEDEDRYLLGNARCLSEGVDVPALDGVAFVDPKRSEIDIIQAVGRAIRLSEGKETGTIVIPVFLSDSDDPDEVLSTSEFDQVWKVVNALRSHDEALGEMLDQFRTKLGRKQKVSFKGSKIVFDVPRKISEEFVEAFETKLVETTTESWEFWFGLLRLFKEEKGHVLVKTKEEFYGYKLGVWTDNQRQKKAKKVLRQDRVNALEQCGFIWDVREHEFQIGCMELREFIKTSGHASPPRKYKSPSGFPLGTWLATCRVRRVRLIPEEINQLNALGIVWDPHELAWEEKLRAFLYLANEYGTADLAAMPEGAVPTSLSRWASKVRAKKETLTAKRLNQLDEAGFIFDLDEYRWRQAFQQYLELPQPNLADGTTKSESGFRIGAWMYLQQDKADELSDWQVQLLSDAGFPWSRNSLEAEWEIGFEAFVKQKKLEGTADLKTTLVTEDGFKLGNWISTQRTRWRLSNGQKKSTRVIALNHHQIRRLEEAGFIFDPLEFRWEAGLQSLLEYKAIFGNTLVPHKYRDPHGFRLGQWVRLQRGGKDKLTSERKAKLERAGFIFDPYEYEWQQSYSTVSQFLKENDGRSPSWEGKIERKLAQWLYHQAKQFAEGKLSDSRIAQLNVLEISIIDA